MEPIESTLEAASAESDCYRSALGCRRSLEFDAILLRYTLLLADNGNFRFGALLKASVNRNLKHGWSMVFSQPRQATTLALPTISFLLPDN